VTLPRPDHFAYALAVAELSLAILYFYSGDWRRGAYWFLGACFVVVVTI
jgi:hypothetical protein